MGVEALFFAHNPRVFDGYGKAYKIGHYGRINLQKKMFSIHKFLLQNLSFIRFQKVFIADS